MAALQENGFLSEQYKSGVGHNVRHRLRCMEKKQLAHHDFGGRSVGVAHEVHAFLRLSEATALEVEASHLNGVGGRERVHSREAFAAFDRHALGKFQRCRVGFERFFGNDDRFEFRAVREQLAGHVEGSSTFVSFVLRKAY